MDCSFITTKLWVGRCPNDAADLEQLKSLGVTAILNLQSAEDLLEQGGSAEAEAQAAELEFRNVGVTDFDSVDLKYKLPACVRELDRLLQAGHTVYLHCTAGVSRSPTVAAAYLHWCLQWPLDRALEHLREQRECHPLREVIRQASWHGDATRQ